MAVQEAELRARGSVKQEHHVAPHLAHCERVAAGADRQGGHLAGKCVQTSEAAAVQSIPETHSGGVRRVPAPRGGRQQVARTAERHRERPGVVSAPDHQALRRPVRHAVGLPLQWTVLLAHENAACALQESKGTGPARDALQQHFWVPHDLGVMGGQEATAVVERGRVAVSHAQQVGRHGGADAAVVARLPKLDAAHHGVELVLRLVRQVSMNQDVPQAVACCLVLPLLQLL
mmetsp:Transcript_40758/g.104329  ORF Transcript_40758/g.104329 Transcript_40758/m.104329 type:complete len:232 (-) Transcript_40758:1004-1699(-)